MDPDQDMNAIMQKALDKTVNELRSLGCDVELDGDIPLFNKYKTGICAHRPTWKIKEHGWTPLVTESKLQSRALQPNESIDSYYSSILSLGAALGHQPDNLATNFLNELPESYRDSVAGTDNHIISNNIDRACLFHAHHPNKMVQFENQFAIADHTALKTDIVNAVAE